MKLTEKKIEEITQMISIHDSGLILICADAYKNRGDVCRSKLIENGYELQKYIISLFKTGRKK